MIGASFLQPFWEKKLFLFPDRIPAHLRKQFFEDYRRCAAFTTFFDLITPQWYEVVQQQLKNRLQELEAEYEKGEQQLQALEQEARQLRDSILRIGGAIQVLREELEKGEGTPQTGVK